MIYVELCFTTKLFAIGERLNKNTLKISVFYKYIGLIYTFLFYFFFRGLLYCGVKNKNYRLTFS